MNYRTSIIKALERLPSNNGTKNPDQLDNVGALVGDIYLWETVSEIASDKARNGWKALQSEEFIPSKEEIRETVQGEKALVKTPSFVVLAKVTNPRTTFDRDKFIDLCSKKFKLDKHKLVELAATCVKETAAPTSLKVLEV